MTENYKSVLTAKHHNYLISYINKNGRFTTLKIRTARAMDKNGAAAVMRCVDPPTLDPGKLPDCIVRVQEITGSDVSPSFDDLLVRHRSPAGDYFDLPSELTPCVVSAGIVPYVILVPSAPDGEDQEKFLRRLLADAISSACDKPADQAEFIDLASADPAVLARFGIVFPHGTIETVLSAEPNDKLIREDLN